MFKSYLLIARQLLAVFLPAISFIEVLSVFLLSVSAVHRNCHAMFIRLFLVKIQIQM